VRTAVPPRQQIGDRLAAHQFAGAAALDHDERWPGWPQTELHVHPNTIEYRIHNAQDNLRVTTNDGRINEALALVLCSRHGAAVLTNDGTQFQGGCSPVHRRVIRIGVKSIDARTRRSHHRDGIASEEWS
jgi:hypothetical protein